MHAHCQVFVQCLHQHTPLGDVMEQLQRAGATHLVSGYLEYKRHVARQAYEDPEGVDERLLEHAKGWPEYRTSLSVVARPAYQRSVDGTRKGNDAWLVDYLRHDVQDTS